MDNPLATANARTTSVIPTPSLLLGTTGGTQCHGTQQRSRSADWTVPGGGTWENTQIYEGTNQIQRLVIAKRLLA